MPTGPFNSDFKVIVILSKDGGEDSHARFLPRSAARLEEIGYPGKVGTPNFRPTLGFSPSEVAANTAGHLNADWSLHPSLNSLKAIYDAGDMAVVHRVGPMVTNLVPFTIQQVRAATYGDTSNGIVLPVGIGGHDWQQINAGSMIARDFVDQFGNPRTMSESGFVGRLMQAFQPFVHSFGTPSAAPPSLPTVYLGGHGGPFAGIVHRSGLFRGLEIPQHGRFNRNLFESPQQTAALARLDAIMNLPQSEIRQDVYRSVTNTMKSAVTYLQPVVEASNTSFPLTDAAFNPQHWGGWRAALRLVSRSIEQRLGAPLASPTGFGLPRRVIYVVNMGDYDTHSAQGKTSGSLPELFSDEATAILHFRNAMISMGMWDNVVLADVSEFSRTLLENGADGTDHAWARTATVIGGQVVGGMYGTPPTNYGFTLYNGDGSIISGTGSHDVNGGEAGGGTLVPGISSEQYWGRILEWFGANATDLTIALPRRGSFGSPVSFI